MSTAKLVNAWILLSEDDPTDQTPYSDPSSAYQSLIKNNVYQCVDILFLCFFNTVPTGPNTIPKGDGSSYTVQVLAANHPGGATNQDYMNYVTRDAKKNNP